MHYEYKYLLMAGFAGGHSLSDVQHKCCQQNGDEMIPSSVTVKILQWVLGDQKVECLVGLLPLAPSQDLSLPVLFDTTHKVTNPELSQALFQESKERRHQKRSISSNSIISEGKGK
jgi:hypothetical protein